ncbi:MAG: hypothetical protein WD208_09115 [Dehalococcoidia bacterium]
MKTILASTGAILGVIILTGAGLIGWFAYSMNKPCAGVDGSPLADIEVKLESEPALYEPVGVEVSFTPCRAPDGLAEAWLELPPSAAFIAGDLRWHGALDEGETGHFNATVAFVAAGTSILDAHVAYPRVDMIHGTAVGYGSGRAFVTEAGNYSPPEGTSTPSPLTEPPNQAPIWSRQDLNHGPPEQYLVDGSILLNEELQPRAFLIYDSAGLAELELMGLTPADPWGRWNVQAYEFVSLLNHDFEKHGFVFALYDQQRTNTGYALSILRIDDEVTDSGPGALTLDVLATAPLSGWEVDERQVSPYDIRLFPHRIHLNDAEQLVTRLILRVNGEEVGEYAVDQSGQVSIEELELPPVHTRALP